jgi:two-component system, LytTR family, response regulator
MKGSGVKIRALIVDDEPPARLRIRRLLSADPEIELAGECVDGASAVTAIQEDRPDLVLLDVQMPEVDGFEVVRQIGVEQMPVTIFVTAHDRYALGAFELHGLDYLLKPFDRVRFVSAVRRAKEQIFGARDRKALQHLAVMIRQAADRDAYPERLPVPYEGRIIFVSVADIDWIEACGNSVRLHVGARCYELRNTLASLLQRLSPQDFVRIHRSTVVNTARIKEIHRWFHGHHVVILMSGQELRMSRYQYDAARRLGLR